MIQNNLNDNLEKLTLKDLKNHESVRETDKESILVSDDSVVSSLDDYT
jgi:hypothetical protein